MFSRLKMLQSLSSNLVLRQIHIGPVLRYKPKPKIEIIDIDMLKMMIPDDDLVEIYDKNIDRSAPFEPGFDFEIVGWQDVARRPSKNLNPSKASTNNPDEE